MKYKIGDKVRIRRNLSADEFNVNDMMASFAGAMATITWVYDDIEAYAVDIDEGEWNWYDRMLENVDTEVKLYTGAKIALERQEKTDKHSKAWKMVMHIGYSKGYADGREDFAKKLYDKLDKLETEPPVFPNEFNDGYHYALQHVLAIIEEIK